MCIRDRLILPDGPARVHADLVAAAGRRRTPAETAAAVRPDTPATTITQRQRRQHRLQMNDAL